MEAHQTGSCPDCGRKFHFINQTEFTLDGVRYCYACYNRRVLMAKQSRRQEERPTCSECGKTFFAAKPCWYLGKPYCDSCFQNIAQEYKGNWYYDPAYDSSEPKQQQSYTHTYDFEDLERLMRGIFGDSPYAEYRGYGFFDGFESATSDHATYRTNIVPQTVSEAFTVLGLKLGATQEDIKKAFKAKALVTHPDVGGKHEEMVKLNKAKEICLKHVGSK